MSSNDSPNSLAANLDIELEDYVATCSQCQLDDRNDEQGYDHRATWKPGPWTDIETLVASGQERCAVCEIVSTGVLNYLQSLENAFTQVVVRVTSVNRRTARSSLQTLVRWHDGHSQQEMLLEFCTESWSVFGTAAAVNARTKEMAYAEAAALLRDCEQSHAGCRRDCVQSSRLPRRLIKIQRVARSLECILVDTFAESDMSMPRYGALSHCWGRVRPYRLVRDNVSVLEAGVSVDILPMLFRDVVDLVLYLGLCYLWIDALCIIQDDEADWEIESAKMGDIYQNAAVAIAATSPPDSRSSLLASDGHGLPTAKNSPIVVRPPWTADALHGRAWAFQEYLLGRCVIDVSAESVSFHCGLGRSAIVGGNLMASSVDSSPKREGAGEDLMDKPFGFRYVWANNFCLKSSTRARLDVRNISVWARIVNIYTLRYLSRGSDRLPALSGLASFYLRRAESDEEYLAGMWRNDFTFCLGWEVEAGGAMPPAYRAPSWSWASVDGVVRFTGKGAYGWNLRRQLVTNIVTRDVCCKLKGVNPFGEVVDGFAVVTGPVIELNMTVVPNQGFALCFCILWHPERTAKTSFCPDVPLAPTTVQNGTTAVVTCQRARSWTRCLRQQHSFQVTVFGLHLSTSTEDARSASAMENNETFLILGIKAGTSGGYERLGVTVMGENSRQDREVARIWCERARLTTIKII